MRIGLHSGTFLGLWYDGPALAPLEFLRRARQLGFDGVELDGRRPHCSPLDLDTARRRSIRETCADLGLEIAALAAYPDLCTAVLEHREAQLLLLREQIRLAREIGAPVVRIFFSWPGVTLQDGVASYDAEPPRLGGDWWERNRLDAWKAARRCLREAIRYADDEGVYLALQNQRAEHWGVHDVMGMVAEFASPRLRACIDVTALADRSAGEEAIRAAVGAASATLVLSQFGDEFERLDDGSVGQRPRRRTGALVDYPEFVSALRSAGYDGYVCYELSHPLLDGYHEVQGIEAVDEQARLALEFMREVLAAEQGSAAAAEPVAVP
jgi:sugar phosphate isomerase/epimerase